jgi:hypothetical protein
MARYGSAAIRGHGIPEAMEQVLRAYLICDGSEMSIFYLFGFCIMFIYACATTCMITMATALKR